MKNSTPIILDTDIGDDIDDALAIALILNSPEIDLRGVTTVFGKTQQAASLVQKMLVAWNREDVPVFAGFSEPLLQPLPNLAKRQFNVLAETDKSTYGHALDFLVGSLELAQELEPEQKLTLVTIGPLTNIAMALARQPLLAKHARIVMMGGQGLTLDKAAWNIRWDPEAAAMVLNSGIEIHQITYDITTQVQLTQDHLDAVRHQALQSQSLALLCQLVDLWQEERRLNNCALLPHLHDPLVVLSLLTDCLQFRPATAKVELCSAKRGIITYSAAATTAPTFHVSTEVNAKCAIELFMERLLAV